MKICMLIDSMVRGGRERRLLELLKQLRDQQHIEVCMVLFSNRIEYPELHEMDVEIHILERKPAKDPRVFYRLYRILKKEKPDVLHSWGWMSSVFAIPSAKLLKIPFLNAAITDAPANLSWMDSRCIRARLTFPFSDIIAANSKAGLKAYQAPVEKSCCMYNGFDFGRIANLEAPEVVRKRLGILPGKVVGMVAAFHQRKDYDTFMKAALNVLGKRDDVTFIAIGNGPNLEYYRAQIPGNYKSRILMPGLIEKVESAVNIFDIGLLCSYSEGISNSIMEYMSLAKAVITSAQGGTAELVANGYTGYLVPVGDWQAISCNINQLLDNPGLSYKMGQSGRARIEKHFSLNTMGAAYLELYNKLISNNITAMA